MSISDDKFTHVSHGQEAAQDYYCTTNNKHGKYPVLLSSMDT